MLQDESMFWARKDMERVETILHLPTGFYESLLKESDWAFVIKLCAFFESLLTASISRQLMLAHQDGLVAPVTKLDMGNPHYGKISLAQRLRLIDDTEAKFIRSLTELRNRLAHGIHNLGFSFADYLVRLDENQARAFVNKFTSSNNCCTQGEFFGDPIDHKKALFEPKVFLWAGGIDTAHSLDISQLNTKHRLIERIQEIDEKALLDAIGSDSPPLPPD